MYEQLQMTALYSVGFFIGYMLIPFIVRKIRCSEEEGIEIDEHYDQLFFSCKFADDVEEAPPSNLTEEELKDLKNKILRYEIPYVNQNVVLYYNHEKEAFEYYANSSIIYKYLNVVARRYVLDFGCKQIFKEMAPSLKSEEKTVQFGPFVPKVGKTFLKKEMNHFIYLGNLNEYNIKTNSNEQSEPKKINFTEYMKLLEKIASEPARESIFEPPQVPVPLESQPLEPQRLEPHFISTPVPETKTSRILDYLKQFSSTPKNQSIKTD